MATSPDTAPNTSLFIRLTPLLTALVAAIAALIIATLRGFPLPFDVAAAFLITGLAATWIARRTPLTGALFIFVLALVVIIIVYGT